MVKYNIEQAVIDERRRSHGQVSEQIIKVSILCDGRWAMPMRHLVNRVVHATDGVQCYYVTTGGRNGACYVYLVGYESQVKQLKLLCESLMLQAVVAMRKFSKEHPARAWMSGSEMWRECKGFLEGFGTGVRIRLERAKKTVDSSGTGTELLLARDARVKSWITDNVGELRDARRSTATISAHSWNRGKEDGLRANTGDTQIGHSRTQINA